ncbi:hypothetical protein GQ457_08G017390 [Hibiscus cannabinus]
MQRELEYPIYHVGSASFSLEPRESHTARSTTGLTNQPCVWLCVELMTGARTAAAQDRPPSRPIQQPFPKAKIVDTISCHVAPLITGYTSTIGNCGRRLRSPGGVAHWFMAVMEVIGRIGVEGCDDGRGSIEGKNGISGELKGRGCLGRGRGQCQWRCPSRLQGDEVIGVGNGLMVAWVFGEAGKLWMSGHGGE